LNRSSLNASDAMATCCFLPRDPAGDPLPDDAFDFAEQFLREIVGRRAEDEHVAVFIEQVHLRGVGRGDFHGDLGDQRQDFVGVDDLSGGFADAPQGRGFGGAGV
jgi:hypothetical protein